MKKMTFTTLFLSSLLLLSCSNQDEPLQEELTSTNAKALAEENYDYLYGIQIYYSSAEAEIKRLGLQKTKLVAELENGKKGVLEQIENLQQEIEKLNRFNEYLMSITPPIGLKGPIKPRPCTDTENCDPKQKLTPITAIVLGSELVISKIIVKNHKNKVVNIKLQPIEDSFGQASLLIKSDFRGEGVMYTTLKTKAVGEITIPTPVVSL